MTEETGKTPESTEENTTPETTQSDPPASAMTQPGDDVAAPAPADWPTEWRKMMAGEDADAVKRLERYKSPVDIGKALTEAQNKLRSTRAMPELGENPSEEDVATYRKEMGIPEKAEGYLSELPEGLVIGDDDKGLYDSFAEAAHKANVPQGQAKALLDWYAGLAEQQAIDQSERDEQARAGAVEELRGELGAEYRARMNATLNFVKSFGDDVSANFMGARLPDGSLLGDNPTMLRFLMDLQQKVSPMGTVAPADGKTALETAKSRIAEIEGIMRSDRARYNKDEKMQAELRQLYEFEGQQSAA